MVYPTTFTNHRERGTDQEIKTESGRDFFGRAATQTDIFLRQAQSNVRLFLVTKSMKLLKQG